MAGKAYNPSYPEELPEQPARHRGDGLDAVGKLFWRRRRILLASLAVCLALAAAYLLTATPRYRSDSKVYVERLKKNPTDGPSGSSSHPRNWLPTQAELMKSGVVLSRVLERPDIARLATLGGHANKLEALKSLIEVECVDKHDILTVSCSSPYPDEAAELVNAVVAEYIAYNSARGRSSATEALDILQKEKAKREADLQAKLQKMVAYKQAHGVISLQQNGSNIVIRRLARLSEAMTQAELEMVEAKLSYELARMLQSQPEKLEKMVRSENVEGVFSGHSEEARLRAELRLAEKQYQQMRQYYTEDHPALKVVKSELELARQAVEEREKLLVDGYLASTRRQFEMAKAKVADINKTLDAEQQKALDLNVRSGEYALLAAEVERAEKMCDVLDERIKDLDISYDDPGAVKYSILERARASVEPYSPQRARVLGIGLMAGLAVGVLISLVLEWTDRRFRSAEDVSNLLDLKILGGVPQVGGRADLDSLARKTRLEPTSAVAEACRNIRTAVHFGTDRGKFRTLLVTSPESGDGKSVLACNLAHAMSGSRERVLLIDADMHRPSQHTLFGIANSGGLSNLPAGLEAVLPHIHTTAAQNLDVLPAGPECPVPAEILGGEDFEDLLAALATRYDRIVIDAPPVAPLADARILSAICDATLMVIRVDRTVRALAEAARAALTNVGANLLGVVMNCVPRESAYRGYDMYGYEQYLGGSGSRRSSRRGRTVSNRGTGRRDGSTRTSDQEVI